MALQPALGQQQQQPAMPPEMAQQAAAQAGPPPQAAKQSKAKRTARSHKKGVRTVKRRGRRGKKH